MGLPFFCNDSSDRADLGAQGAAGAVVYQVMLCIISSIRNSYAEAQNRYNRE